MSKQHRDSNGVVIEIGHEVSTPDFEAAEVKELCPLTVGVKAGIQSFYYYPEDLKVKGISMRQKQKEEQNCR